MNATVNAWLADMNGRKGFRQNWDQIDDHTRAEIVAAWEDIVVSAQKVRDFEVAAAERARIRKELLALDIYDLTGTSESDLEVGEPVKPSSAKRAFRAALDRICPKEE